MAKYVGQHARDRVEARLLKEKGDRQQLHVGEWPIIDGGTRRVADQVVTRALATRSYPVGSVHNFFLVALSFRKSCAWCLITAARRFLDQLEIVDTAGASPSRVDAGNFSPKAKCL